MSTEFWNDRYKSADYAYGREPNEFLKAEAHRIPKGRVLCLAEGEGRNAVFLAGLGHDVTAVDFSLEGIRKTEALAKERRVKVTTVRADLSNYEIEPNVYTGIVAIFAHVPPAVRARIHAAVTKGLQLGGVYVLEAYTPEQIPFNTGGPKDPALLMTLEGLRVELAPLTLDVGRECTRTVTEGLYHTGEAATVQIVAKRVL